VPIGLSIPAFIAAEIRLQQRDLDRRLAGGFLGIGLAALDHPAAAGLDAVRPKGCAHKQQVEPEVIRSAVLLVKEDICVRHGVRLALAEASWSLAWASVPE
jgi:hypothetical protein